MSVHLKITSKLLNQIRSDLLRPHPFAAERIGFLFARPGTIEGTVRLVLGTTYMSVPDDQYIDDPSVGARINGAAIREVMQRVLEGGEGAFHVHMHEHRGRPWFSRTDRQELHRLVPSFQTMGPAAPHGGLLLSKDDCVGLVWLPGEHEPTAVARISVIGQPLQFFERWF